MGTQSNSLAHLSQTINQGSVQQIHLYLSSTRAFSFPTSYTNLPRVPSLLDLGYIAPVVVAYDHSAILCPFGRRPTTREGGQSAS